MSRADSTTSEEKLRERLEAGLTLTLRRPAPSTDWSRRLRALARRLWSLAAGDGIGERFAAERARDQGLARRVERGQRPPRP